MLAAQLKVERRTIINHLKKLTGAGFIRKKFRGTNADYELWIHPAVLLNAPTANPQFLYRDEEKAATAVRLFFTSKGYIVKNFLPIYLFKHLEISNRRNSVDNPNWSSVNSSQHPPQVTCNEQDTSLETFSCHTPKASIGVVDIQKKSTVHEKEKKGGAAGGAKKQVPGWQKAMVLDFCQYFTTTLYPLHTYQGDTRRNILNKIYFDVYFKFSNADFTRDDWGKYQKELLERVDMIRRWLDRPLTGGKAKEYKDGKFLVNPLTFLDKNCKYGFKNTAYWLDLRYKHRALIKAELELEKAAKEMLSDTDKLRVYRKWETRFKNKRLPEALELFYGTMANIQKPIGELTATQ